MDRIPPIEEVTFRHPPEGSNADWDELLSGVSVEQQLIKRSLERFGHTAVADSNIAKEAEN